MVSRSTNQWRQVIYRDPVSFGKGVQGGANFQINIIFKQDIIKSPLASRKSFKSF
jgi:hypothetical protein